MSPPEWFPVSVVSPNAGATRTHDKGTRKPRKPNAPRGAMTARVAPVLARTSGNAPCTRCLDVVDVTAGRWHAADAAETHRAVCDRCALRDDAQGFANLLAWRRAARPTRKSAA